ncbi:hypothetical protein BHM03_00050957 [Ensete ventricosum]|uniref:Uncharacterized protein n=1 Tax=Ensete ventricosum TaxID=4639 RepID=A0A445MM05_ENSVE|nr:hypothetical protein BHM03_00050957 [Ensete ventricosum]
MSEHNRRWRRPYDVLVEATHGEIVVRVHHINLIAMEMSLGGDMVQLIVVEWLEAIQHTWEKSCEGRDHAKTVERGEEATTSPEGLSYPKAKRRSERRWTRRSATVPQRRIYRSRRKGRRCKARDSRTMGLAALWYRRSRTSVESSISCSHGGSALVVKGVEEVEN